MQIEQKSKSKVRDENCISISLRYNVKEGISAYIIYTYELML